MVEADAAVFIILGVFAVLVGMAPVLGVLENFMDSGISPHDNEEEVDRLAGLVEDQCGNLQEYETALTTSIDIRIIDGEEVILESEDRLFVMEEADKEISFNCEPNVEISLQSDESEGEFGEGDWEASVSGSENSLEVEMTK